VSTGLEGEFCASGATRK